jgi:hypothetical protein
MACLLPVRVAQYSEISWESLHHDVQVIDFEKQTNGLCPLFDTFCIAVIVKANVMRRLPPARWFSRGLAISLIGLLLSLAPFAVAQDVHHELAAADTDGHEHSDTDLCQWVQHHTSGSTDLGGLPCSAFEIVGLHDDPAKTQLFSIDPEYVGPSRAPPQI